MKVLFLASEVTPIAKVGGLGDVIGALPKALSALGVEVRIVTGYYGTHDEKVYPTRVTGELKVPWGDKSLTVEVRETTLPGSNVPVYFMAQAEVISSGGVYDSRTAFAEGQEEIQRFLLISKAAVQLPELLKWLPDVWHLHDWHAATVTEFLPKPHAPTLLTIHNLANQAWASPETARLAGLPLEKETEHVNLFRFGLERASWLSTVSPTYAKEIQSPPEGEGLEQVLSSRQRELVGITNGIDTEFFDPESDTFLVANYKALDCEQGKSANRAALQKEFGLQNAEVPLVGLVSRLVNQKGMELIPPALRLALDTGQLQFIFLGMGDPAVEKFLTDLALEYPGWCAGAIRFDEPLSHRIYAGSDFFLMPSKFEPCGLGQLISMRYGTVPIVRATGGLKDTVVDAAENNGTGIMFEKYEAPALRQAVERGLAIYRDRATMEAVRHNAMEKDSSWAQAGKEYLALYNRLCQKQ